MFRHQSWPLVVDTIQVSGWLSIIEPVSADVAVSPRRDQILIVSGMESRLDSVMNQSTDIGEVSTVNVTKKARTLTSKKLRTRGVYAQATEDDRMFWFEEMLNVGLPSPSREDNQNLLPKLDKFRQILDRTPDQFEHKDSEDLLPNSVTGEQSSACRQLLRKIIRQIFVVVNSRMKPSFS
jgi:hypothetical protein